MKLKLTVYSDPGHGWVAVKRDILHMLGIASKISIYSYQRGKTVYLEEDCDAATLVEAAQSTGIDLSFIHKNSDKNSVIRSYNSYRNIGLSQYFVH